MGEFDTDQLTCFKKVAELEHMTNAARELYISQAQLSRTIADLEKACGVQLFDRVGKGIKLNKCGREYYDYVQQYLVIHNKALNRIREINNSGHVLSIISNCCLYLPGLVGEMSLVNPSLCFKELSGAYSKNVRYLKEGRADFSISYPLIEDIDIKSITLIYETSVVIYPEGHWLKDHKSVSVKDLAAEYFIGLTEGYGTRLSSDTVSKHTDIEFKYRVETSESSLIMRQVKFGIGIACMPLSVVLKDDFFKDHYVMVDELLSGNIGLSWRRDRKFNDIDNEFFDCAVAYFNEMKKQ